MWQNLQFCPPGFVHGRAFEVHHAMPILGVEELFFWTVELKRHKVYYDCSISIKFPQSVTKVVFLTFV